MTPTYPFNLYHDGLSFVNLRDRHDSVATPTSDDQRPLPDAIVLRQLVVASLVVSVTSRDHSGTAYLDHGRGNSFKARWASVVRMAFVSLIFCLFSCGVNMRELNISLCCLRTSAIMDATFLKACAVLDE